MDASKQVQPVVIVAVAAWRALPLLPHQAAASVQKTLSTALGLLTGSRPEQLLVAQAEGLEAEEALKAVYYLLPLLSCPLLPTQSAAAPGARRNSLLAWASAAEATAHLATKWQHDELGGWTEQWASVLHRLLVLPAELLELLHDGVAADNATILNHASASWSNLAGTFARFGDHCFFFCWYTPRLSPTSATCHETL